jgi:hypothetical protein
MVHTANMESISIDEALDKAVMPDKMKRILNATTQMVQSIFVSMSNSWTRYT